MKTYGTAKNAVVAKAFIVGVAIAVLLGLFGTHESIAPHQATLMTVLVVAGLIVGFFNVSKKETNSYLIAAVSLVIVSSLGGQVLGTVAGVGSYLTSVFSALMAFIVPATLMVGLMAIYNLASD